MKNELFDNMLSRYDLTTEQHKRNAIFEVNNKLYLRACMPEVSLIRLHSMVELA